MLGEGQELEPEHLDALQQHQVERDPGDRSRGVADGHEPAAVAQRPQGRLGEVAADRVDDDVGTVGERGAQRRPQVAGAVVDHVGGPALGGRGELVGGRRHRGDLGAEQRAELHGREPDAAAGAEDDERLAGLERGRPSAGRGRPCGGPPRRRRPPAGPRRRAPGGPPRPDTTTSSANAPTITVPVTRSPTATPCTSGATSVTVPASSLPGTNGVGTVTWYWSATRSTSGKFTAAAAARIRTCPGPRSGAGSSSIVTTSGPP